MAIGNLLLKPQPVQRALNRKTEEEQIMEDLVFLVNKLFADAKRSGAILESLNPAFDTLSEQLNAKVESNISAAIDKLVLIVQPLRDTVEEIAGSFSDSFELEDTLSLLETILSGLTDFISTLSPNSLRTHIGAVLDIVEQDLGINQAFFMDLTFTLLDEVETLLFQEPEEESEAEKHLRLVIATAFRRVKQYLLAHIPVLPKIDAEVITQAILKLIDQIGLGDILDKIHCSGLALTDLMSTGMSLSELVKDIIPQEANSPSVASRSINPSSSTSGDVIQTEDEYLWYGSWLLEQENRQSVFGTLETEVADSFQAIFLTEAVHDSLKKMGIVLSSQAVIQTEKTDKNWKIVDNKQFVASLEGNDLKIFRQPLFQMDDELISEINALPGGSHEDLTEAFKDNGFPLLGTVDKTVELVGSKWVLTDTRESGEEVVYSIALRGDELDVYPLASFGFLFELTDFAHVSKLDDEKLPTQLYDAFKECGIPLLSTCDVEEEEAGLKWLIEDSCLEYEIEKVFSPLIPARLEVQSKGFFEALGKYVGWPGDKLWLDKVGDEYKVVLGDRIMLIADHDEWWKAPIFKDRTQKHYTFTGVFSPTFMEGFTFVMAIIEDLTKSTLHIVSAEKGDYASNIFNAWWYAGFEALTKIFQQKPLSDSLTYGGNWTISNLLTIMASFEGVHNRVSPCNWVMFWMFVLLSTDLGEKALYAYWVKMGKEFLIGSATLINHKDPEADDHLLAQNNKHLDNWGSMGLDAALASYAAIIPKDDYTYPFNGEHITITALYWPLAIPVGMLGAYVGCLLGSLFSMTYNSEAINKITFLKSIGWSISRFWAYTYLVKEGDTNGGTYNPDGADFAGYPDSSTSPYHMPYENGKTALWGQCNQGMWSHHDDGDGTVQVYAFDIALDQEDEVWASRPGTVSNMFDWTPNDTSNSVNRPTDLPTREVGDGSSAANYIAILHNVDDSGAAIPPDNDHDVDQGGAVVATHAAYLHGRNASVRRVFAERLGIPIENILPSDIIGRQVRKGDLIMTAGDTGISFHNHLHFQIRPDNGSGAMLARTIPMVFVEDEKVPKVLNSYTSQNPGVTLPDPFVPQVPHFLSLVGTVNAIIAAGTGTISVENTTPNNLGEVIVEVSLPSAFTYQGSTISGGDSNDDSNSADRRLSWTINDSVAGGPAVGLTFNVDIDLADPDRHLMIYHHRGPGGSLIIRSQVDNPAAADGDPVSITLTVENPDTTAVTNVFIRTVLTAGYTYSGNIANGDFQDDRLGVSEGILVWTIASLPASGTVDLTFDTVRTADPNIHLITEYRTT